MTPAERAAHLEAARRRMWPELLDAYDHRDDGLAARYAFDVKLKMYAIMFHNNSRCRALAEVRQYERGLQKHVAMRTAQADRTATA